MANKHDRRKLRLLKEYVLTNRAVFVERYGTKIADACAERIGVLK